jgi:hypothetical protein
VACTRTMKARCPATVAVSAAVLATLMALEEQVRTEGDRVGCELGSGHCGSHLALVATVQGGDQWWWLRWDGQLREVIQIDPCEAELPQGQYADGCVLPDGHPGPHSFDLSPPSPGGRTL